ncbi:hypothetical protein YB2330_004279 [Saitoella coloradoensis]
MSKKFELHVHASPAFSLPSIDPLSVAALAYLQIAAPGEFTVVESSVGMLSSDGMGRVVHRRIAKLFLDITDQLYHNGLHLHERVASHSIPPSIHLKRPHANIYPAPLPSLRVLPEDIRISGYTEIIAYLKCTSYDADSDLEPKQLALSEAYSALITSRGIDLTLLSLYADYPNYSRVTRHVLSAPLPFPASYVEPFRLRTAAQARVERLGFNDALGSNFTDEVKEERNPNPRQNTFPLLTAPQPKLSPENLKKRIALTNLASEFYAMINTIILQNPLRPTPFVFGDQPSSVDALLFGVLSTHLYPELPNPWLASELRKQERVAAWTHEARRTFIPSPLETITSRPSITSMFWDAIFQQEKKAENVVKDAAAEVQARTRRSKRIMVAVGGVVAFIVYVFAAGIVRIEVGGEEEEEGWVDGEELASGIDIEGEQEGGYVDPDEL